jgi:hypothetical protein
LLQILGLWSAELPNLILGITASSGFSGYAIGSIGPGGGIVFYDAGSILSWGRYMEIARYNTWYGGSIDPNLQWSATQNVNAGTVTTLGTAKTNTDAMISQNSTAGYAGTAARAFTGGGKSDWSLASGADFQAMANSGAGKPGDLEFNRYWCSGEDGASNANQVYPHDPVELSNRAKSQSARVRPIRYFS